MKLFHQYELEYMKQNMCRPKWLKRYHVDKDGVWSFEKFISVVGETTNPSFLVSPDTQTHSDVQWNPKQ